MNNDAAPAPVHADGEGASPALLRDLASSSATVRARAAVRLGRVGSAAAVPALAEVLAFDEVTRVRRAALSSLVRLDTDAACGALRLASVADESRAIRREAARASLACPMPAPTGMITLIR